MLPGYFSAFFGHVLSPPIISFPMPPIAPLQSTRRGSISLTEQYRRLSDGSDSSASTQSSPSSDFSDFGLNGKNRKHRSSSMSTEATVESQHTHDDASRSSRPQSARVCVYEDGTRIGSSKAPELFPSCNLQSLDEHTLFITLNRAVGLVFAVKEAMWEELVEKTKQDKQSLVQYGWELQELDQESCRQRFEALIDQYRKWVSIFIFDRTDIDLT